MKPLIVVVAGIKRSGSTVQFNLIRIALEMAGYKVRVCGHEYDPCEVPEGCADVVKRHPFSKEIAECADHIFLTDRSDEDVIKSMTRFYGKKPSAERLMDMQRHFEKWMAYTDHYHVFHYREWFREPIYWCDAVIQRLQLEGVYAPMILEEFDKIKPPTSGQDPKTLLFSNHITSK